MPYSHSYTHTHCPYGNRLYRHTCMRVRECAAYTDRRTKIRESENGNPSSKRHRNEERTIPLELATVVSFLLWDHTNRGEIWKYQKKFEKKRMKKLQLWFRSPFDFWTENFYFEMFGEFLAPKEKKLIRKKQCIRTFTFEQRWPLLKIRIAVCHLGWHISDIDRRDRWDAERSVFHSLFDLGEKYHKTTESIATHSKYLLSIGVA